MLGPSLRPEEIAAGLAKVAQESLGGLSVGSIFADEVNGELYRQLYVVLPNRAGDDFVAHLITLAHVQDMLLAEINRTALILALPSAAGQLEGIATGFLPQNGDYAIAYPAIGNTIQIRLFTDPNTNIATQVGPAPISNIQYTTGAGLAVAGLSLRAFNNANLVVASGSSYQYFNNSSAVSTAGGTGLAIACLAPRTGTPSRSKRCL